jgi:hypothetical protein
MENIQDILAQNLSGGQKKETNFWDCHFGRSSGKSK